MLKTEIYETQRTNWPAAGRHILAQFDDETIVVYQAYRPSIGHAAARNGRFGEGGFSFDRMSWIKPNFLWMMFRAGWGTKEGQEVILAIRLKRAGFDRILKEAVHSSFVQEVYENREAWKRAVKSSSVRLQWDPDHNPAGHKVERRAVQLGLRGDALSRYAREYTVSIEDVSQFVAEQRSNVGTSALRTPAEDVYPVHDTEVYSKLGLDS